MKIGKNFELNMVAFQMEVHETDFSLNCERILQKFKSTDANLSVFPEAASSGFIYEKLEEISSINQDFLPVIQKEARRQGRSLVLPLLFKENEKYYNRTFALGPDGEILATYDKVHLIGVLNESAYLEPGNAVTSFTLPLGPDAGIKVGLATCYDLRFPELFRKLSLLDKVDLILLPAMWPRERQEHLLLLTRARAIENLTPVLSCNAVNSCGFMDLCGSSSFWNARGEGSQVASDTEEQDLRITLEGKPTRAWRMQFPALRDAKLHSLEGD